MPEFPVRQPTRAPGFDYRNPGPYFITICEYRRINRFGTVIDSQMHLNAAGRMVANAWRSVPGRFAVASLDAWIVMPNHFHALITLSMDDVESNASISSIVQWFKSVTTTRYVRGVRRDGWQPFDDHLWQGSFHDRIVRNHLEWQRIYAYIENNPALWEDDVFFEP